MDVGNGLKGFTPIARYTILPTYLHLRWDKSIHRIAERRHYDKALPPVWLR